MADNPLAGYPHGATVRFADEHCLAAPGVHSATWLDARDADSHDFLVTFVHPDTDDIGDDDIVVAADRNVWCVWDDDTCWFADEPTFAVPVDGELPDAAFDQLYAVSERTGADVHVRPGWTTELVAASLAAWAASHGRADLVFEHAADYRAPYLDEIDARIAAIEAGALATYEIAPGIVAAGSVLDELLAEGIDEAAALTGKIVETLSPLVGR